MDVFDGEFLEAMKATVDAALVDIAENLNRRYGKVVEHYLEKQSRNQTLCRRRTTRNGIPVVRDAFGVVDVR